MSDGLAHTGQAAANVMDRVAEIVVATADGVTEASGWVARFLVYILIPIGFLNVALRYVGQYVEAQLVNNTWIEAQWYLYGVIFLLMFPYLLRHDGNVRVDFWYAERSDRVKAVIDPDRVTSSVWSLSPLSPSGFRGSPSVSRGVSGSSRPIPVVSRERR